MHSPEKVPNKLQSVHNKKTLRDLSIMWGVAGYFLLPLFLFFLSEKLLTCRLIASLLNEIIISSHFNLESYFIENYLIHVHPPFFPFGISKSEPYMLLYGSDKYSGGILGKLKAIKNVKSLLGLTHLPFTLFFLYVAAKKKSHLISENFTF